MELATKVLVLLHLIGFAALFGGFFVQLRVAAPEINLAMLHGAWTQLVTGIALVVLAELGPDPVNHVKIGIKLVVTVFVVLLVAKNRRFESVPRGLWAMIGVLTLGNAAMAVLWS